MLFCLLCILSNQCGGLQPVCSPHVGWQDGLEVGTLASDLSSLGLNPDVAINCHHGVSQTVKGFNVCAVLQMNVQLGIFPHNIRWWTLKTPRHLSWRVGELSLAHWPISKFLSHLQGASHQWHSHTRSNDATSSHCKQIERMINERAPSPPHLHSSPLLSNYCFINIHFYQCP